MFHLDVPVRDTAARHGAPISRLRAGIWLEGADARGALAARLTDASWPRPDAHAAAAGHGATSEA